MDTARFARNVLVIGLNLALPLAVSPSWAAPTPVQQCQAAKMKAIARYYMCRMREEARVVGTGNPPDLSKCDASVQKKFAMLEAQFGSPPIFGCSDDSLYVRTHLLNYTRRDADDMACRLGRRQAFDGASALREGLASRIERPGSIVFVDFELAANPILSLRNTMNSFGHARCFYVSRGPACVGVGEFPVDLSPQTEVAWPASQGAATIPPVPASIPYGYLVCVDVDDNSIPIERNGLIASVRDDNRCAQDGRPIEAFDPSLAVFTLDLCLGNQPSAACPEGADYEPCPFAFEHSLKPEMEGCWSTVSSFKFHCQ